MRGGHGRPPQRPPRPGPSSQTVHTYLTRGAGRAAEHQDEVVRLEQLRRRAQPGEAGEREARRARARKNPRSSSVARRTAVAVGSSVGVSPVAPRVRGGRARCGRCIARTEAHVARCELTRGPPSLADGRARKWPGSQGPPPLGRATAAHVGIVLQRARDRRARRAEPLIGLERRELRRPRRFVHAQLSVVSAHARLSTRNVKGRHKNRVSRFGNASPRRRKCTVHDDDGH